jgi:hypothetical protein
LVVRDSRKKENAPNAVLSPGERKQVRADVLLSGKINIATSLTPALSPRRGRKLRLLMGLFWWFMELF